MNLEPALVPMDPPYVEAFAPATVSNLGPGFDCLGLSLQEPGDRVRMREMEEPGVRLLGIEGDEGRLPRDIEKNTATAALDRMLKLYAPQRGIELELYKGLPMGSGLGSSGASACAALVAANKLLGLHLGQETLVDLARYGEQVACGVGHPDNVSPCIFGGMVLIASLEPLRVLPLPKPENLWIVVYTPGCVLKTADARAVLPQKVPLSACVRHAASLALLIHALHTKDHLLLGEAICDHIVEPARAGLIPGFLSAKTACMEAGAIACSISGAGPTTFALSDDHARAQSLLSILDEQYHLAKVPGEGRVQRIGDGTTARWVRGVD